MSELIQLPDTQSDYKRLKEILANQGYDLGRSRKTFGFTKQQVRLIDIFVITPFLLYASQKTKSKPVQYALIGLAVATLLYNGVNYVKDK